jgi:hypothetical protein
MTLTGPVDRSEREHVATVLGRYFGDAPTPIVLDRLTLSVQDEEYAPYHIHSTHPFAPQDRQLRAAARPPARGDLPESGSVRIG